MPPNQSLHFSLKLSTAEVSSQELPKLAEEIQKRIIAASQELDLRRLDAVIASDDYIPALQAVNRGDPQFQTLVPTKNEHVNGGAMTFPVVRGDDELWSVVVIWAPVLKPLLSEDSRAYNAAAGWLLHELAHVHECQTWVNSCPGGWRSALPENNGVGFALWRNVVGRCPSEYCAQRWSAWLDPEAGTHFLQTLQAVLYQIGDQFRAARQAYTQDYDLRALWSVIAPRMTFLFQSIGYFTGHLDGLADHADENGDWIIRYDQEWEQLTKLPVGWLLQECRQASRPFFDIQTWPGDEIYGPFYSAWERLLNEHGLYVDWWPWGELNLLTEPISEEPEDC